MTPVTPFAVVVVLEEVKRRNADATQTAPKEEVKRRDATQPHPNKKHCSGT